MTDGLVFNTPPNWPQPPEGWRPPTGWAPHPDWPPAPHGWQFWIESSERGYGINSLKTDIGTQQFYPPPAPVHTPPPVSQNVYVSVPQQQTTWGKQVVYNRQQKGHSVVLHVVLALFTAGISLIWTIYYAASPNHYFHT